jgi:hypothetical protein
MKSFFLSSSWFTLSKFTCIDFFKKGGCTNVCRQKLGGMEVGWVTEPCHIPLVIFHGAPIRENKGEAIVLSLRLSYHLPPFAGKVTFESQQNTGHFNLWTNNSWHCICCPIFTNSCFKKLGSSWICSFPFLLGQSVIYTLLAYGPQRVPCFWQGFKKNQSGINVFLF